MAPSIAQEAWRSAGYQIGPGVVLAAPAERRRPALLTLKKGDGMWLPVVREREGRGINITPGELAAVCLGPKAVAKPGGHHTRWIIMFLEMTLGLVCSRGSNVMAPRSDFQLLPHVEDCCTGVGCWPSILVVKLGLEAVGKDHEAIGLDGIRVDGGVRGGGRPPESTRDGFYAESGLLDEFYCNR